MAGLVSGGGAGPDSIGDTRGVLYNFNPGQGNYPPEPGVDTNGFGADRCYLIEI